MWINCRTENGVGTDGVPAPRRAGASCCEALEGRLLLSSPGDFDTSFGGTGQTSLGVGDASRHAYDVAVQSDGKTVVVGGDNNVGTDTGFFVVRYNLNGSPDATFGPDRNGTVFTPFGNAWAQSVVLQNDGRILVAGTAGDHLAVVRYNADGSRDASFDGDGIATFSYTRFDEMDTAEDMTVQSDGKIVIVGSARHGTLGSADHWAVARLNANGSLDDSFNTYGTRVEDFGGAPAFATGVAMDYSGTPATNPAYGKIYVSGNFLGSFRDAMLFRYNADGSFDSDFGIANLIPNENETLTSGGLVVQSDGKIVVSHRVISSTPGQPGGLALVRLKPAPSAEGYEDKTFGTAGTGWVINDFDAGQYDAGLVQTADGALIQLGVLARAGTAIGLVKVSHDGVPDAGFGTAGRLSYPVPGTTLQYGALAYGPGRRFVVAGGPAMHAARFFDTGANLVYAVTLNPTASETGPTSRGFFVYRLERLPSPTRVYFDVGGTATAPFFRARNADYTADGMAFPIPILGHGSIPYVDIPANETFTVVTITPVDDSLAEGNETAVFTIRPDAGYEVGDPSNVLLNIVDNDAPPPSIAAAYVRGSAWRGDDGDPATTTFGESLAAAGLGDATDGFRVDNVAAGTTLPWTAANQIILRYDYPPTGAAVPTSSGVTVKGVRSDYGVTSVRPLDPLDPRAFVVTLDRPLGNNASGGNDGDRVTLTVPGGAPGGSAYSLVINPLQGDADRAGGRVNAVDLAFVKARLNRTAGDPPGAGAQYTAFADANGDGRINAIDLGAVKARLNHSLPSAFAAEAAPVSLFGTRPVRDDSRVAQEVLG